MKTRWVILNSPRAGNNGQAWDAGKPYEWEAEDAARMVKAGAASFCEPPKKN